MNNYIRRIWGQTTHTLDFNTPDELRNVEDVGDTGMEIRVRAIDLVSKKGAYLEFGVYNGHSINLFAGLIKPKMIYGFDSFEGLPVDFDKNAKKGTFSLKGRMPKVRKNVRLVKGKFDDTLPKFVKGLKNKEIAFIHVDSDLYSSAKTIFNNVANLGLDGTLVLFDEFYGFRAYKKHEYKAFKEFLASSRYKAKYLLRSKYGEQVLAKLEKR